MDRHLHAVAIAAALLGGSCATAMRAPDAPVASTLSPPQLGPPLAPRAPTGPLRVAFGAPSGETHQASEITIVFDRPMRALGPGGPPPPVTLTPIAKGSFTWLGSSAVRFDAEEALAPATRYRVEVPAGARAADGSTLAEPYVLTFSTPRPSIAESIPAASAVDVEVKDPLSLAFSQPVTDAEVLRAVSIRPRGAPPIPFALRRMPDGRVELRPARALPIDRLVSIHVDASLRGERGELPAGADVDVTFHTRAPLAVTAWTCTPLREGDDACDPRDAGITVRMNHNVELSLLARAVVISPAVRWDRAEAESRTYADTGLEIRGDFKPGVTYKVRLDPRAGGRRLGDDHGDALVDGGARTLRFGDAPPQAGFGVDGATWPKAASHAVPVGLINVLQGEVRATRLSEAEVLRRLGRAGPTLLDPIDVRGPTHAPGAMALIDPAFNAATWTDVRLEDLLTGAAAGPIALDLTYGLRGEAGRSRVSHVVQVTDLGVTARLARDEAVIFATRLADAAPVPFAEVEVHRVARGEAQPGPRIGAAVTGPDGIARVKLGGVIYPKDKLAVFVREGGSFSYVTVDAPPEPEPTGILYTDRGIYRAGETVKLSGVVRVPTAAGLVTPAGAEVAMEVGGGPPLLHKKVKLSAFGTFTVDVPIPKDWKSGSVSARLALGGGAPIAINGGFRVADYRPTEIAAEVSFDGAGPFIRGDVLTCRARGRYLHGGAMAGATASFTLTQRSEWRSIPGLERFAIWPERDPPSDSLVARGRVTLDATGAAAFPVKLAMADQLRPQKLRCDVELQDLNREVLAKRVETIAHPGELYVAIASITNEDLRPEGRLRVHVLAVTPSGERRAAAVRVEIVRRTKDPPAETRLGTCDVTTGAQPVDCAVSLPPVGRAGLDIAVRARAQDTRGNALEAGLREHLVHVDEHAPPAPPPRPDPPRLYVRTAESYDVGATGHLEIHSPFAGAATALVTFEREGLLLHRVVPITGAVATMDFPVTADMIPGVVVRTTVLSGKEVAHDTWTRFEVSAAPRRLDVVITTAGGEAHAPGEEIDVDVVVKDAAGHPARSEVTLYAADEATLTLAWYRLPPVLEMMFLPRPSLVNEADARDALVRTSHVLDRLGKPPRVRMGATSVRPERGDFRQTAFFVPHLVTDATGHVRRRVKLPDGLTTYRVMAVAVAEDDRFGAAQASVKTSLPLMARATVPRFLRAGDRFEASVVVTSAGAAGDVEVTATPVGASLEAGSRRVVRVAAGVPAEVRFPLRVDRAGPTRLSFSARLGSLGDATVVTPTVVAPTAAESVAVDGETSAAIAERLGDLASVRPDYGGLQITLAPSALAGLREGIEQLVEYPYGCTEQTVSRLVPMVALGDLATTLGAKLPLGVDAAARVAVGRLLENQRADGGFGLWPSSAQSEPWMSAYALWGLGEARRHGLDVPAGARARARKYLEQATRIDAPGARDEASRAALNALFVDVLAEDGVVDAARIDRLYEARDRLPPFARSLLLHAMAVAKADAGRRAEVLRSVEASIRLDGKVARAVEPDGAYAALLDSGARSTALALRAILAQDPGHPLVARLAKGLLAERRDGRFRTTQEAAWALVALDALRRARPAPGAFEGRAFLGDQPLLVAPFSGGAASRPASVDVPIARVLAAGGRPLTFAVEGAGEMTYEARLRFSRAALPTASVESGFFLRRTTRLLDAPGGVSPSTFPAGELVVVELDVVTPSPRDFVVLESPLPAGFEPVDGALRTGAAWLQEIERSPAARREMHDDRVVYFVDHMPIGAATFRYIARATAVGTFVTPPARVEEMYVPETFARTAGETIVVKAR